MKYIMHLLILELNYLKILYKINLYIKFIYLLLYMVILNKFKIIIKNNVKMKILKL